MRRGPAARPEVEQSAFAGFRFPPEVITVAVRWYLRYGLSYRDVEELLAERGVEADHVTVYGWVQPFTPLFAGAARPQPARAGTRPGPVVRRRDLRERSPVSRCARRVRRLRQSAQDPPRRPAPRAGGDPAPEDLFGKITGDSSMQQCPQAGRILRRGAARPYLARSADISRCISAR